MITSPQQRQFFGTDGVRGKANLHPMRACLLFGMALLVSGTAAAQAISDIKPVLQEQDGYAINFHKKRRRPMMPNFYIVDMNGGPCVTLDALTKHYGTPVSPSERPFVIYNMPGNMLMEYDFFDSTKSGCAKELVVSDGERRLVKKHGREYSVPLHP